METHVSTQPAGLCRRVVFWRHGRTAWNAAQRFQGQTDIPLDAVGHAQALRAATLLAGLEPSRIVSSDLERARDTAGYLARLSGLTVSVDPRLREIFAGVWQGMTFGEIEAAFPADALRWKGDDTTMRVGGGETRVEVAHRLAAAVQESLLMLPAGETMVLATHGGAARVGIAHLLGLPEEHWGVLSGLANCQWSVLEEVQPTVEPSAARWKLSEYNAGTLPEPVEPVED
ncbi:histidine phosphatase family protein [Pseudarthrobacter sp. P1]|uniref:histidine phosphatase family protein n=1 Tax=Pseudarthrobacter sp. P1 TaxID=3418418 RepID=UPI003CED6CA9